MKRTLITFILLLSVVTSSLYAAVYIGDMKLTAGVTYTKNNCKWIKNDGSVLFEVTSSDICAIHLNNVYISTVGEYERGIYIESGMYHNASLNLNGVNEIYSDLDALVAGANYNEIEGSGGTLELNSSLKAGVLLQDFGGTAITDLRLWEGVTFIAQGQQAIVTKNAYNSVRVSGNCNLWLKSNDGKSSAVEGVRYFYLHEKMSFILPYGGKYDDSKLYMTDTKGNKYTGEVKAGEFSQIVIGGEYISSWNWDNIHPECLKKGTISYDHENHVLTLRNATLEWDEAGNDFNVLIYFLYKAHGIDDFTIRLYGDNYLNLNKTQVAIYPSLCKLRIEGSGTLNIHSPEGAYRAMVYITPHYPVTLACKEVKMVSESTNYNNIAFLGAMNSILREDRKLIIDNTRLDITSPEYTFFEVDSIITNNVELVEPEGAEFDYEAKKIMVGSNNVVPHVVFDIATYPVTVKGEQVTRKNKDDILGDGTVKYHPDTHSLVLNNAYIETNEEDYCIFSTQDIFNIKLQGHNTIKTENNAIGSVSSTSDINNKGLMTIIGPGSLDISAGQNGIMTGFQDIGIKDCDQVNIKATFGIGGALSAISYALGGSPAAPFEILGIKNSNVTIDAEGEESAPLVLYELELTEGNVKVVEPSLWQFKFPFIYDISTGEEVKASRFVVKRNSLKGDVNLDGSVDISDIVAVIHQIAGTATYSNADVNGDYSVDISDIVAIVNIIAGK